MTIIDNIDKNCNCRDGKNDDNRTINVYIYNKNLINVTIKKEEKSR